MSLIRCLTLAFLATSCAPQDDYALNHERAWEIFAALDNGDSLHLRLAAGNRGLRRGEGDLTWAYLPAKGPGMNFHERQPPELVTAPPDGEAWTLSQTSWEQIDDRLRVSIRTRGALEGRFVIESFANSTTEQSILKEPTERTARLTHPHASISGAWTAGGNGEIIEGRAVALQSIGAIDTQRTAEDVTIHVLAADASLTVLKNEARTVGWLTEGGITHIVEDIEIATEGTELNLRSETHALNVALSPKSNLLTRREFPSGFGVERWIAKQWSGPLERVMWNAQTTLHLGKRPLPARGVVLDGYGKSIESRLGPKR